MNVRMMAKCVATLLAAWLLTGCASTPKAGKIHEPKWYESNMNDEERSFFLGSFFGG